MMKATHKIWWIFVVFPFVLNAQVRVKGSSEMRVLEEGTVRVTGNTEVASGAQLSILGDYTTSGNLTNNGGAANVVVESDAAQTGSLIVEGTATGDIRVERFLSPSTWHFLSTSVSGASTTDFYFNGNPDVYASFWDEPNSAWPYIVGTNEAMPLGVGYKMWVAEAKSAVTAEMEGSIRTSDLSVNLTTTGSGWNLIGNPFTSELDVRLGVWGTNTSGSFWVWDSTFNGGDYRVSSGIGEGTLDGIIPISQSFFVYAESAGNYTIPKEAQTHHDTVEFYKENKSSDFVRLQLDVQGKGNTLFVGFPSIGTNGIDRLADVYKLYSSSETPQLYGVQEGEKLCILADAPLNSQVRIIPLYIDQWIDGAYTLTLSDVGGLAQMDIYLEDKVTGSFQFLSQNKTYHFIANANSAENRFNLHFSKKAIGLDEVSNTDENFLVYARDHSIFIKANNEAAFKDLKLKVFNINGQLIYESAPLTSNQINVPTDLSTSCYFVHLQYDQNTVVKKVIVNR
jgi:hypothetical protein